MMDEYIVTSILSVFIHLLKFGNTISHYLQVSLFLHFFKNDGNVLLSNVS